MNRNRKKVSVPAKWIAKLIESDCNVEGYVTKEEFFETKQVADGINKPKLEPNTWFMDKSLLADVDELASVQKPDLQILRKQYPDNNQMWVAFDRRSTLWEVVDVRRAA